MAYCRSRASRFWMLPTRWLRVAIGTTKDGFALKVAAVLDLHRTAAPHLRAAPKLAPALVVTPGQKPESPRRGTCASKARNPPQWRVSDLQTGAAGGNRTPDTRIFSPLLYRLSYRGP